MEQVKSEENNTPEANQNLKTNLDIEKLEVGDYLSEVQYYKVVKINPKTVSLINEKGVQINFDKDLIGEGMYSASQYETEKTVNRTEINEILQQAGNNIFTVNFYKQVQHQDIREKLLNAIKDEQGNPLPYEQIEKTLDKISRELTKGEERTLIGYLFEVDTLRGRSLVIDIEISPQKNRIRQIDHRTINWLILKNTKYIVK
jgi:transcriptional regulator NrdR family protein